MDRQVDQETKKILRGSRRLVQASRLRSQVPRTEGT
jgi:hypothetical protein